MRSLHINKHIHKQWKAQVTTVKEAVAAEAEEEDKVDDAEANKDDSKLVTSKPKWSIYHSKNNKKKKPSKSIEPLNDNLNDYFGPSQSHNSQKTADIMPVNTPKKSEEAKLKNNLNGSSCRRVDEPPEPPLEPKQPAQDSEVSSLQKTNKSAWGLAE